MARFWGDDVSVYAAEVDQEDAVEIPTVLSGIVQRIDLRLRNLGITAAAASKAAGKPNAITELQRALDDGRPHELPIATLNALAGPLRTAVTWLTVGVGRESSDTDGGAPVAAMGNGSADDGALGSALEVAVDYVQAEYAGVVEAGTFRTVEEFEADPDRGADFVPKDPDLPFAKLVTFTVSGDSTNALKPDPIRPGAGSPASITRRRSAAYRSGLE